MVEVRTERLKLADMAQRQGFLAEACRANGDFEEARVREMKARCLWKTALSRRAEAGTSLAGRAHMPARGSGS